MPKFHHRQILIALTILLASAICSCRSHKEAQITTAATTQVVATAADTTDYTRAIVSKFQESSDVEISDIVIEFFPPDTIHPNARAAPKSVSIGRAKALKTAEADVHDDTHSTQANTRNITASSKETSVMESRQDTRAFHIPAWLIVSVIILGAVGLLIILKRLGKIPFL